MNIPEEFSGSNALQYIQSKGWNWKIGNLPNVELEICPYCQKSGFGHCYVEIHGATDPSKNRDGLHACHKCGKGGSLYSLKTYLGDVNPAIQSQREWAGTEKKVEDLPNIDTCHQALLEDADAMDYLVNGRGFSRAIIEQQKLGLLAKKYFRNVGEVRALVYPYLVNGNCVFVHYRTLPTMPLSKNRVEKAFSSPTGWDAPLYNGEILRAGLKEVVFVEGEANTIAAMDHGLVNVVGAPGANFKKAEWLDTLDKLELEKIYICYDNDKVGNKAAQALASRIGIERCYKINLPSFTVITDSGETRQGKDINEWFVQGKGSTEAFETLKQEAQLFDVSGVESTQDAVQELLNQVTGKTSMEPKYTTGWPSLNARVGFEDGDVIDICAGEKQGKTTFGINLLEHMVNTYGEDGLIICLEMPTVRLARKWVCHVTGLADNMPKTAEDAVILKESFLRAIPEAQMKAGGREGNLYFCYPQYKTCDDIYKLIKDCIRRYGVRWVMIDNIQRLCDTTLGNQNRTIHLSQISKTTSKIAKDENIQMVRILQPHRIKEGSMITTDNVDGASQIAKDCDCMITLHRGRIGQLSAKDFDNAGYVETEAAFDDKMLATVGLSRYSAGGYATLHYDGPRSTINEYDVARIVSMKAKAQEGVGHDAQLNKIMGKEVKIETVEGYEP